jgi:hypothetical protein
MILNVEVDLTIPCDAPSIHVAMDDSPKENEVDFYYEVDPNYRIVPANTILTTITGNDIKLDFAIESLTIPTRMRMTTKPKEGAETSIVDTDPKDKMVRRVQVGIFCSLEQAENIAKIINGEITRARKLEAQKPAKG